MAKPKLSQETKDECADKMVGAFVSTMKGDGVFGHAWSGMDELTRADLAEKMAKKADSLVSELEAVLSGAVKEWVDDQDD